MQKKPINRCPIHFHSFLSLNQCFFELVNVGTHYFLVLLLWVFGVWTQCFSTLHAYGLVAWSGFVEETFVQYMCYCFKINDKYNRFSTPTKIISYPKKDIIKTHMDSSEDHEQVKSASGCSVFHERFLCRTGSCQSPLAESKKVEEEDSLSNSSSSDAEEYLGLEGRGSVGGVGGHCVVLLASLFSFKSVSRYPSSLALTLASLFILAYSLPSQRFSLCFSAASRLIFF